MNARGKPLVLLFEDDKGKGPALKREIEKSLGSSFRCERFNLEAPPGALAIDRTYEDQLAEELRSPTYLGLSLIVSDRDLSRSLLYRGLSEAVVCKVAAELGVPVCVYAAGKKDSVLERQRSGGDGRIILDPSDLSAMADRVAVLAQGFKEVNSGIEKIAKRKASKQFKGPAAVLASMLEAPEAEEHLSLYTRGDQRMVSELLPEHKAERGARRGAIQYDTRRVATALGTWLYDSVLRFPGLLLDALATSSFLGIDEGALEMKAVRKAFAAATYKGPFSTGKETYWWRHRLAEVMASRGVSSGLEFLGPNKGIKPSKCTVDNKSPTGYVCIVTRKPVCEAHSVGHVSWLPRGADLARVRRDVYEELGPWIGM